MRWRILSDFLGKGTDGREGKIISVLLRNRGLKSDRQIREFFDSPRPHALMAEDLKISPIHLKRAIKRLREALKRKEKVIVYGDYDADGICATAILWECLYSLGFNTLPFVPDRDEGYGLRVDRLEELKKEGACLVITVDQGIVHEKQAAYAKKIGLDLIITDHHLPGEKKPTALAIIHTILLSGSGVAWFLSREILKSFGREDKNAFLDLAAVGTITDMVPLLGPSRSLAKYGIVAVRETKIPGLISLFNLAGIDKSKVGAYEIGFLIGPRINAAGRMAKPIDALRLVCTKNIQKATKLAEVIDKENRERQTLTGETLSHARKLWLSSGGDQALIFIGDRSYRDGIIGLVSAKLTEEFSRPSVVIARGKVFSKGSARSIEGFNIVEAIRSCAGMLESCGGHSQAAGFTVRTEKLNRIKEKLIAYANENIDKETLSPTLKVDSEIEPDDINFNFYYKLEEFAPFGAGNRQPVFVVRRLEIKELRLLGKENKHLKLWLGERNLEAIGFGFGHLVDSLAVGQKIDIAFCLQFNDWNNHKTLQLKIKDLRTSD